MTEGSWLEVVQVSPLQTPSDHQQPSRKTNWNAALTSTVPKNVKRECPKCGNFTYHIFLKNSRPVTNREVTGCARIWVCVCWGEVRNVPSHRVISGVYYVFLLVFPHFKLSSEKNLIIRRKSVRNSKLANSQMNSFSLNMLKGFLILCLESCVFKPLSYWLWCRTLLWPWSSTRQKPLTSGGLLKVSCSEKWQFFYLNLWLFYEKIV